MPLRYLEWIPVAIAITSPSVFGFDRYASFYDPPPHTITVPVVKILIAFFYCGASGIRFRISVLANGILTLLNAVSFANEPSVVQPVIGFPLWFTSCISMLIAYKHERNERATRYQILLEEIDSLKSTRLLGEKVLQLSLSPQVITALREADGDFNSLTGNTPEAAVAFLEFINLNDLTKPLDNVNSDDGKTLIGNMIEKVQLLNTLLDIVNVTITEGGGEFIKNIGDKRIFHDVSSATDFNFQQLKIRAGVHSGPITYGVIGDLAFTFDIFGDTVNMASRMLSLSSDGDIFMTDDVVKRIPVVFIEEMNIIKIGCLRVKGKGEIEAWKTEMTNFAKHSGIELAVPRIRGPVKKRRASIRQSSSFRQDFLKMNDRAKDVFREQLENEQLHISANDDSTRQSDDQLPSYYHSTLSVFKGGDTPGRQKFKRPRLLLSRKVDPATGAEKYILTRERSSIVNVMSSLIDEITADSSKRMKMEDNGTLRQRPFSIQPIRGKLGDRKIQKEMLVLWRLEFRSQTLELIFGAAYGGNLMEPLNSSAGVVACCTSLVGSSVLAFLYLPWHQVSRNRTTTMFDQGSKVLGVLPTITTAYKTITKAVEVPIAIFCCITCTFAVSVLTPAFNGDSFFYRYPCALILSFIIGNLPLPFRVAAPLAFLLPMIATLSSLVVLIIWRQEFLRRTKFLWEYAGTLAQELCKAEKERSLLVLKHTMSPRIRDLLTVNASAGIVQYNAEGAVIAFDIVGFTSLSSKMFADDVVFMSSIKLNHLYRTFDNICRAEHVEKICTVGDAYIAVAGLPEPLPKAGQSAARVSLQVLAVIAEFNPRRLLLSETEDGNAAENIPEKICARIGLHVGPVCGALVGGQTKVKYDLVGLSFETAVNLEQSSAVGHIHVSEETLSLLDREFGGNDSNSGRILDILDCRGVFSARWDKHDVTVKTGGGYMSLSTPSPASRGRISSSPLVETPMRSDMPAPSTPGSHSPSSSNSPRSSTIGRLPDDTQSTASSSPPSSRAGSTAPRRAARNLLKNYYGIQAAASPGAGDTDGTSLGGSDSVKGSSEIVGEAADDAGSLRGSSYARKFEKSVRLKSMGPNPMDMDSPFFVPETFMSKCVNEMNLSEMIQTDNELVTEIKELDGNMKTLVYGNYNKFISAAGTIRAMKAKVENMEEQMSQLEAKMSQITDGSTKIHTALSEKRVRIRQLTGVHNLLQKLHFVFELPKRMEESLKQKKYGEAERNTAKREMLDDANGYLSEYFVDIASIISIEDTISTGSSSVLMAVLEKINLDTKTLSGLVRVLDFDERFKSFARGYIADIIKKILGHGRNTLMSTLKTCADQPGETRFVIDKAINDLKNELLQKSFLTMEKLVDGRLAFLNESASQSPLEGSLDIITKNFEKFFDEVADELKSLSVHQFTDSVPPISRLLLLAYSKCAIDISTTAIDPLFRAYVQIVINGNIKPTTSPTSATSIDSFASGAGQANPFDSPLGSRPRFGSTYGQPGGNVGNGKALLVVTASGGTVASAMGSFDVYGLGKDTISVNEASSSTSLNANATSPRVTEGFMDSDLLMRKSADVISKGKVMGCEWKILGQSLLSRYVFINGDRLSKDVVRYFRKTDWRSAVKATQLDEMWQNIVNDLTSLDQEIRLVYDDEASPVRRATSARRQPMKSQTVPSQPSYGMQTSGSFSQTVNAGNSLSPLKGGKIVKSPSSMLSNLTSGMSINFGGNGSNNGSQASFLGLPTASAASSIRRNQSGEALVTLGAGGPGIQRQSRRSNSISGQSVMSIGDRGDGFGSGAHKFEGLDDIDKMFQDRMEFFGGVEGNRSGIITAIVRIVAKCYIEETRDLRLARLGLNKVQLDTAALLAFIGKLALSPSGEQAVTLLCEGMGSNAHSRCFDPVYLDQEEIDRIIFGERVSDDDKLVENAGFSLE
ncbi:Vacuolar protein sorting-associated protein 51 [Blyttiomyces sp. JEL0837]|nr:Vacuolar protein sorting-associated protein 51 [Blyttiomyces sp. JEL0837]